MAEPLIFAPKSAIINAENQGSPKQKQNPNGIS